MKIYVVIKDIDDYFECGGGEYPDAIFLNYANAKKYAKKKQRETNAKDELSETDVEDELSETDVEDEPNITWRVETWETVDEEELKI